MFKRLVLCKQNACFNTSVKSSNFIYLKVKSFKLLIQSGSLLFLCFSVHLACPGVMIDGIYQNHNDTDADFQERKGRLRRMGDG